MPDSREVAGDVLEDWAFEDAQKMLWKALLVQLPAGTLALVAKLDTAVVGWIAPNVAAWLIEMKTPTTGELDVADEDLVSWILERAAEFRRQASQAGVGMIACRGDGTTTVEYKDGRVETFSTANGTASFVRTRRSPIPAGCLTARCPTRGVRHRSRPRERRAGTRRSTRAGPARSADEDSDDADPVALRQPGEVAA
jgi:hypothetical protein